MRSGCKVMEEWMRSGCEEYGRKLNHVRRTNVGQDSDDNNQDLKKHVMVNYFSIK